MLSTPKTAMKRKAAYDVLKGICTQEKELRTKRDKESMARRKLLVSLITETNSKNMSPPSKKDKGHNGKGKYIVELTTDNCSAPSEDDDN